MKATIFMKIKKNNKTGLDHLDPENNVDVKALEYLKQHVPIFAGMEMNIVNAFKAGYETGKNEYKAEKRGENNKQAKRGDKV